MSADAAAAILEAMATSIDEHPDQFSGTVIGLVAGGGSPVSGMSFGGGTGLSVSATAGGGGASMPHVAADLRALAEAVREGDAGDADGILARINQSGVVPLITAVATIAMKFAFPD